jgi:hypothetical protein
MLLEGDVKGIRLKRLLWFFADRGTLFFLFIIPRFNSIATCLNFLAFHRGNNIPCESLLSRWRNDSSTIMPAVSSNLPSSRLHPLFLLLQRFSSDQKKRRRSKLHSVVLENQGGNKRRPVIVLLLP